jgi:hypothetical protein
LVGAWLMSPDEDEGKPASVVQLREAERFPELQIDFTDVATEPVVETIAAVEVATETVTEFLPVVVPTEAAAPVDPSYLGPADEDTFVPYDVEQRLIYRWLLDGPDWRADIVVAPPPIDPTIPIIPPETDINPLRFSQPRQIGYRDDGTRRMIKVRE